MHEIRNVKLELLRSGPANNQLLSPLTPYLALCGADGPVTVTIPFEHGQLLTRLARLRYEIDGHEVAPSQRQAEAREIGEALGRVLSQVPGLLSELSSARSEQSELVHLRLSVGAYELALVPFELAIGQDGYPGSGSPLLLQSIAPITLTREVRRGRPLPVEWNRPPRILFVFASPGGLPAVPAQAHLLALRRAIDPWVPWRPDPAERVQEVAKHLTVLPDASLQAIRNACAETAYTHVHILAHGQLIPDLGQYGLSLCADGVDGAAELVDGEALATALTAGDSTGGARSRPTLVSLATCDSGNAGSVITAGGSVAHALHAGGIPWVIASQFPLWMHASSIAADVLFSGLLRGDDPRRVLYTLRQKLRTDSTATHDWASIVAYAVVPWDFTRHVESFRDRQTRQRIEMLLDQAQRRTHRQDGRPLEPAEDVALDALYDAIRRELVRWCEAAPPREKSERLGTSAAQEKRIGDQQRALKNKTRADAAYRSAIELYGAALDADPLNDWAITQYLSMQAVMAPDDGSALAEKYGAWWSAARQIATWKLRTAAGDNRAWALGTLAELALLGTVYGGSTFNAAKAEQEIKDLCGDLVDAVGKDGFPVASTRRQFDRYLNVWPRDAWTALAKCAVDTLPMGASWVARAYVPRN